MKFYLILSLFIYASINMSAQSFFSGYLLNKDKDRLEGAKVFWSDWEDKIQPVTVNKEGYFKLERPKTEERHVLVIQHPKYNKVYWWIPEDKENDLWYEIEGEEQVSAQELLEKARFSYWEHNVPGTDKPSSCDCDYESVTLELKDDYTFIYTIQKGRLSPSIEVEYGTWSLEDGYDGFRRLKLNTIEVDYSQSKYKAVILSDQQKQKKPKARQKQERRHSFEVLSARELRDGNHILD
ncbi:MAG: hypothetical protein MK212_18590 [Saprospiraceae bacterium]|nr:hypothetical protein [Saprospiraceae bacterium]